MAKGRKVRASRAAQGKVEFSHFPPAVHFDLIRKQAVVIPADRKRRFSRNAETDLVCRLLLEKKKQMTAVPSSSATASRDTSCVMCSRPPAATSTGSPSQVN